MVVLLVEWKVGYLAALKVDQSAVWKVGQKVGYLVDDWAVLKAELWVDDSVDLSVVWKVV